MSIEKNNVNLINGQLSKRIVLETIGGFTFYINYSSNILLQNYFLPKANQFSGLLGSSWYSNIGKNIMSIQLIGEINNPKYSLNFREKKSILIFVSEDEKTQTFRELSDANLVITFFKSDNYWRVIDGKGLKYFFGNRQNIAMEDGEYNPRTGDYSNSSQEYKNSINVIKNNQDTNYLVCNTICSSCENKILDENGFLFFPNSKSDSYKLRTTRWNISSIEDLNKNKDYFYYIQKIQSPWLNDQETQFTVSSYLYKIESINSENGLIEKIIFKYDNKNENEVMNSWNYNNLPNDIFQQDKNDLFLLSYTFQKGNDIIYKRNFNTRLIKNVLLNRDDFVYRELFSIEKEYFSSDYNKYLKIDESVEFQYYQLKDFNQKNKIINKEIDLYDPINELVLGSLKGIKFNNNYYIEYKYKRKKNIVKNFFLLDIEKDADIKVIFSERDFSIVWVKNTKNKTSNLFIIKWTNLGYKSIQIFDKFVKTSSYFMTDLHCKYSQNAIFITSPDLKSFKIFQKKFSGEWNEISEDDYKNIGGNYNSNSPHSIFYLDDNNIVILEYIDKNIVMRDIIFDEVEKKWYLKKIIPKIPAFKITKSWYYPIKINKWIFIVGINTETWTFNCPVSNWPHDPYKISSDAFAFLKIDSTNYSFNAKKIIFIKTPKILSSWYFRGNQGKREQWTALLVGHVAAKINSIKIIKNRLTFFYESESSYYIDADVEYHGFIYRKKIDWGAIFDIDFKSGDIKLSTKAEPNSGAINFKTHNFPIVDNWPQATFQGYWIDDRYFNCNASASFVSDGYGGGAYNVFEPFAKFRHFKSGPVPEEVINLTYGINVILNAIPGKDCFEDYYVNKIKENDTNLNKNLSRKNNRTQFEDEKFIPGHLLYKDLFFIAQRSFLSTSSTLKSQSYATSHYFYDFYSSSWKKIYLGYIENFTSKIIPNKTGSKIKKGFDLWDKIFSSILGIVFGIVDPPSILFTGGLLLYNQIENIVKDLILTYYSHPSINMFITSSCFSNSQKHLIDGNTIWYREKDGFSLASLGSGEGFQIGDSLSNKTIDGEVVKDSNIFGVLSNIVPFATTKKEIYSRKIIDKNILEPNSFAYFNDFNDIFYDTEQNEYWFFVGQYILIYSAKNKSLLKDVKEINQVFPIDDLVPIQHKFFFINGFANIKSTNKFISVTGWNLFVWERKSSYDFNLITIIDISKSKDDILNIFYDIDSITNNFLTKDENSIVVIGNNKIGVLQLNKSFQEITIKFETIKEIKELFNEANDYTNSICVTGQNNLLLGYEDNFVEYSIKTKKKNYQWNTKKIFGLKNFDSNEKDFINYFKNKISIFNSNHPQMLFFADSNKNNYGDSISSFVVSEINEYYDKNYITQKSDSPSRTWKINYNDSTSVLNSFDSKIAFKQVILNEGDIKEELVKDKK